MNGNAALSLTVPQDKAAQVDALSTQGVRALAKVKALVVNSPETEHNAVEWLGLCAQAIKDIETQRVAIVAPIKKITAEWDARARQAKAPYDQARKIIEEEKLRPYRKAVRAEQDRKQRELEEAERMRGEAEAAALASFGTPGGIDEKAGDDEDAAAELVAEAKADLAAVPEVNKTLVGSTGMTASHMEWTFKIVTPDSVPRSYCVPDERLIRAAVKAGVHEIAGVHIYEEERFAHRGW